MSRILRYTDEAPTVYIGGQQRDARAEARAEKCLGTLFPMVSVLTAPDGSKLIPIEEVFKIETAHQAKLDETQRKGFQDGHTAGYEEGLERGRDEARRVMNEMNLAVRTAIEQREELLNEARRRILDLIIQISRKVTYDAIEVDPEATTDMISAVIDELVDRSRLKIKVNPDHLPLVEQNIDRFMAGSATIKEISIEPDPRVRFGGCFIETPGGDIDARLESQFDVIEEAIKRADDQTS